jgi:hypothetical protein
MKPMMHTICLLALCAGVSAQEHKPAAGKKPSTLNIPQPAPEMKRLAKALIGTWNVAEKIMPNPMMPKGGTGKGMDTVRIGPGSTSILSDYKGNSMGNFVGHGIMSWSPEKKVYESVWVDSMMPGGILTATGNWEGEDLVFTGKDTVEGKQTESRQTYSNIKPDSFTFTLEVGPEGKLEKFMVLEYKRVPAPGTRPSEPGTKP